jgi:hypothetical protein
MRKRIEGLQDELLPTADPFEGMTPAQRAGRLAELFTELRSKGSGLGVDGHRRFQVDLSQAIELSDGPEASVQTA